MSYAKLTINVFLNVMETSIFIIFYFFDYDVNLFNISAEKRTCLKHFGNDTVRFKIFSIYHTQIMMFCRSHAIKWIINPFVTNPPFLYPLKTLENRKVIFSGGRERVHWERMG